MRVKQITQEQVIQLMKRRQGKRTAKELAEELGITPQYLSDIYLGKREPGPSVLDKLGLEKEVLYRPLEQSQRLSQ